MVVALVGEHVPSRQEKRQLDRRNKLQGDVIFFPSSETYFRYEHKNTNTLGTKLIIEKMVFALVGDNVPSSKQSYNLIARLNSKGM